MESIVSLLILIVVLQLVLSLVQIRYYDTFIRKLVMKYKNSEGNKLTIKKGNSKLKSVIVVLVINENKKIVEAYEFNGNLIFSKFKPIMELKNATIDSFLIRDLREKISLRNKTLLSMISN